MERCPNCRARLTQGQEECQRCGMQLERLWQISGQTRQLDAQLAEALRISDWRQAGRLLEQRLHLKTDPLAEQLLAFVHTRLSTPPASGQKTVASGFTMSTDAPPAFIFFDLDDTLIDDEVATRAAVDVFFGQFFKQPVPDRYTRWQAALNQYYPHFLMGKLSAPAFQRARIRHVLLMPELPDDKADRLFEFFMQHYIAHTTCFPETQNTLSALHDRGVSLGIITNGTENMQHRKIHAAGLEAFFPIVVTSERAGAGKPDKAIFDFALRAAGMDAGQCGYVGDHFEKDALAACEAGLTGIWLDRGDSQLVPASTACKKIVDLGELC